LHNQARLLALFIKALPNLNFKGDNRKGNVMALWEVNGKLTGMFIRFGARVI
tara:strand:- start:2373 stop:2528 length:156 start_codon:yes stop_codon:yes gene_type:complete